MIARKRCSRHLRHLALIGLSMLLCGCVKFYITVDVEPNGSGTVGAALGLASQAKAFMEGQDIGDPSEEIRAYLEREAFAGEVAEVRWIDGDYEWVEYRIPFDDLQELNTRVSSTEFFESFEVKTDAAFASKTFTVDGVMSPAFLESQIPSDVEFDVTQMFDMRLAVNLPGEVTETNGLKGPRDSNTVWWRIEAGDPIPIHAVSELREVSKVRWLAVGGVLLAVVGVLAVALIGFGAYRLWKRRGPPDEHAAI